MQFLPFSSETKEYIKILNYEWLEKYFNIEPKDELELCDPQQYIIDKGGYIFYLYNESKIIGVFALMKITDFTFELGKMAITASHQGKGLGNSMLNFCIQFATNNNIKELILYSNKQLVNAIHLYKKFGFSEIPLNKDLYKRANIKMQLFIE